MFLITGVKSVRQQLGVLEASVSCPHCGLHSHFLLVRNWQWFTLFYVPIVPFWIQKQLCCPLCDRALKVSAQERALLMETLTREDFFRAY